MLGWLAGTAVRGRKEVAGPGEKRHTILRREDDMFDEMAVERAHFDQPNISLEVS